MNDGDFARYVVDPLVGQWSPAPIGTLRLPTDEDVGGQWEAEFLATAGPEASDAFWNMREKARVAEGVRFFPPAPEAEAFKEAESAFMATLTVDQREEYRTRCRRWVRAGSRSSSKATFDNGHARRWICKRAHDLGWSEDLHAEFDQGRGVSRGRMSHSLERIGKKYQWLALYELAARLADNCAFIGDRFSDDESGRYDGEADGRLRNIDPSLLIRKTLDDGWRDFHEPPWWLPCLPKPLPPLTPEERLQWLYDDRRDMINGP